MHGDASSRFKANSATLGSGEVARTDPAILAARGRQCVSSHLSRHVSLTNF